MDKGLDIETRQTLLALHGAAYADARLQADVLAGDGDFPTQVQLAMRRARRRGLLPRWDLAERALDWLTDPNHHLLIANAADYPPLLRAIAAPPLLLFVDGDANRLGDAQVAVVGSRNASPAGCDNAHNLATALAAHGATVTSGLARGIDGAAHRGALAAGGATIAVLGCAIDQIYPSQHRALAAEIRCSGALVSEFPFGAPPLPAHFPQRNRIISGLALGTVVVEAAIRSGSISTALHAAEQGREVFAVPGSIRSPLSKGCHALIKQGAKLVESIEDIVEELPRLSVNVRRLPAPASDDGRAVPAMPLSPGGARLLAACGWDPFSADELVLRSGLTVQEVSSMLLTLELAGVVQAQATGSYLRIR